MEQHFGIIELVLVFGIALGLLGYELYSVKKTIADDRRKASDGAASGRDNSARRT